MSAATNSAVATPSASTAGPTVAAKAAKKKSTTRLRLSVARLTSYLLVAIIALGGFLRFYRIGDKGLWLDEAFSVWMGWNPLPELIAWLLRGPAPTALLHAAALLVVSWQQPCPGAHASAALGTLTIPVIFLIARRISGTPAGLIAALILALSPFSRALCPGNAHVRFVDTQHLAGYFGADLFAHKTHAPRSRSAASSAIGCRTWRAARKGESAEEVRARAESTPPESTPPESTPPESTCGRRDRDRRR